MSTFLLFLVCHTVIAILFRGYAKRYLIEKILDEEKTVEKAQEDYSSIGGVYIPVYGSILMIVIVVYYFNEKHEKQNSFIDAGEKLKLHKENDALLLKEGVLHFSEKGRSNGRCS